MINDALLAWARSYIGLAELEGPESNPVILEMARILDLSHITDDSRNNWCGVFLAFCARMCGAPLPGNPTIARNWASHGAPVLRPIPGDVVVLWTGDINGTDGHVGLYEGEDDTHYWLIGGNQVDAVRSFRYEKTRLLAIRRLHK